MGRMVDARKRARRKGSASSSQTRGSKKPKAPSVPAEETPADTPPGTDAPAAAAPGTDAPAKLKPGTRAAGSSKPRAKSRAAAPAGAKPGTDGPAGSTPGTDRTAPEVSPRFAGTTDREPDAGQSAADDEVSTSIRPERPLSLPSSGLAEEILAQAEQRDDKTSGEQSPAAEPSTAALERGGSVSFLASAGDRERGTEETASEHLVTFLLDSEEYGIDVSLVQEIIRVSEITPVPRSPDSIKGVSNLRGKIIPVIDLKRKLSLGHTDSTGRRARVVVVRLRGRLIGLLVDGASQVLKVPETLIEAAPEEAMEINTHFIRGVAKLEERLIVLISLEEILAVELRATTKTKGVS